MRNTHVPASLLALTLVASASAALAAPPTASTPKAPAATPPAAPAIRFAEMDANHDGQISRQEWKGNAVSFAQQDTNSDGVLAGAEIAVAAEPAAGGSQGQPGVHDRGRLERVFRKLDRNKDGRLSPAELTSPQKFERLDSNHDRFVSKDEYLKQ